MKKHLLTTTILITLISLIFSSTILAADTKVDFVFSRNVLTFKRDSSGKNVAQTPIITISGITEPEKVTGYSATYIRTHGGDGARLAKSDTPTAQPSLAGTYTIVMKFNDEVPFVCKNGQKAQDYTAALIIKRAEQAPPILRSASPALKDGPDKKSGSIEIGKQAIVSVAWASGLKPILTWTAGSDAVVTPEEGKPARFTAKAAGTAVLTALLPEDNNYLASPTALYTVNVGSGAIYSEYYDVKGTIKGSNGWYNSDITILGKNGFTRVVAQGTHPISTDGVITLSFALENDSGGKTEDFSITVKRDATAPSIDNVRINDSPWVDAPEDYEAAWAADSDLVITADIYDATSGIAKLEYRIDGGDYISDENIAFKTEGCTSHEFTYTADNTGHVLWLRATDTAGNVTVKDYVLPAKENTDSSQSSISESVSESVSSAINSESVSSVSTAEITEPTDAMNEIIGRLTYLKRCDIEARVAGDVRANADYITTTLEMFTALSSPERKALGEDNLSSLRAYFEMLYTVQNKDTAELEPLFIFTEPLPASSVISESADTPPESSSAVAISEGLSSSVSQSVLSSSSVSAISTSPEGFNFLYLIPVGAVAAAFIAYFVWRKKLSAPKTSFELPNASSDDSFNEFKGFNDMDE